MTTDVEKSHLLTQAIALAERSSGTGGPPRADVGPLLHAYYRHVSLDDVGDRSAEELYGALVSHYRTADSRPQGTARVHVFTPTLAEHGWSAGGHSVVEVVTDDMPFLVDSVVMELTRQQRDVHLVIHPQFDATRDLTGRLEILACPDNESAEPPEGAERESWMHIEISRVGHDEDVDAIAQDVQRVLRDVRESVEDWDRMRQQAGVIVEELRADPPTSISAQELERGVAFLEWLCADHFTFLGYREYHLERDDDGDHLRGVPGTGYGILRNDPDMSSSSGKLPSRVAEMAREHSLLVLAKANSRSTVHRPAYLDYVGVKTFDDAGEVIGERRFLGLFSSAAYTESVWRIPLLRERAKDVLHLVGLDPHSHAGKSLIDTLETYPRDELFHTPVDELAAMATRVMESRGRRQLRIFVRRDTYGRYVSVLVFLPRDRYNTTVRERFSDILKETFDGESVEFTVRMSESTTARVHFVVHPPRGVASPDVDVAELERRLTDASRSWRDDFTAATITEFGEDVGSRLARTFASSFPEAYKEDFSAATGALDLGRLQALGDTGTDLSLFSPLDAARGEARLKVFRRGDPISLSEVLPALSSMGVEVVDERPYQLDHVDHPSYIYEFGLRYPPGMPDHMREAFQDTIRAVWDGFNEIDGFNALVLGARLTWRQATVLRAYAKYMKQGNSPFAVDYIEAALRGNTDITRLLVQLFEARFDPGRNGLAGDAEARTARVDEIVNRIERALDDVASLDHDRILRSYLTHIRATLRTNYFQLGDDGKHHAYMSFKLEPSQIPDLPQPRPRFEIFVYSPRVEGVHLRFGAVARGGLRWSDRRDDFRTEVLGLVKAQMVKNTVIVPVGAKGGFFCKQLPDPSDREAWMAEGVSCYKTFICGLLDITDNLVGGENVPPEGVVRHDSDDSYLVVAADKGTATFSDIANGVAKDYDFWLGDAFASGGSVGYDHKAMGITARGAWVVVQRHFRERGVDCQTEDFTCVGIGDMSGDVFGNGLLCSEHTLLVAAFDHRDIFLDPSPDAAASFAERKRLFGLPRSSWQDYDSALISEGGGVFSRSLKSIPISPQVRKALGLETDAAAMTPAELMKAILQAPVDLLWNGGIGTYVKSSDETHADAGDKANDTIRIDGRDLRARCVGEGGNLGLTQRGRIEYAVEGATRCGPTGRRDQHRLHRQLRRRRHLRPRGQHQDPARPGRPRRRPHREAAQPPARGDDRRGGRAGAARQLRAEPRPGQRRRQRVVAAPRARGLDEDPRAGRVPQPRARGPADLARRTPSGRARRGAHHAGALGAPGLDQDRARRQADRLRPARRPVLPRRPDGVLPDPAQRGLRDRDRPPPAASRDHRHPGRQRPRQRRRHDLLAAADGRDRRDAGGADAGQLRGARDLRLAADARGDQDLRQPARGQHPDADADRDAHPRRARLAVAGQQPPAAARQPGHRRLLQRPVSRADGRAAVAAHRARAPRLREPQQTLVDQQVPEDLASRVAVLHPAYMLLGVIEIADRLSLDPAQVARLHFALGERLGLPDLVTRILELPREDRWQTMARAALRDDVYAVHAQLTAQVLRDTSADDSVPARIAEWEDGDSVVVQRAASILQEICQDDNADLARMSVGLRVVRGLLAN